MIVEMYSVSQGYGFCSQGSDKVFFRVEDFVRKSIEEPQPILGEKVLVSAIKNSSNTPKAFHIERIEEHARVSGEVTSFDSIKGWGFARCKEGVFFIHKSDFVAPFVPLIGNKIYFYKGTKNGKKRACYISRS